MSGVPAEAPNRPFPIRYFVLLWLAVTILIALRDTDVWLHPHFYAEDGQVFYSRQAWLGFSVIFQPYNGYLHLLPRLGAAVTWLLPARFGALSYAIFGTVAASLGASYFFLPSNRFIVQSDALRATACLITASCFDMFRMTGDLLNLQWFLLPASILVVARCVYGSTEIPRRQAAVYCVILFSIGLTVPILIVVAPLIIWAAWRARDAGRGMLAALLAALAIQSIVYLQTRNTLLATAPYLPFWDEVRKALGAMCTSWSYRSVLTALFGKQTAMNAAISWPLTFPLAFTCLWLALPMLLMRTIGQLRAKLMAWALVFSLILTIAPLLLRNIISWYSDNGSLNGYYETPRYYIFAAWFFVYLATILVEGLGPRPREPKLYMGRVVVKGNRGTVIRCAILTALFSFGIVADFAEPDGWRGRNWQDTAGLVENWHILRNRHARRSEVRIPIQPEPWTVYLPGSEDGR